MATPYIATQIATFEPYESVHLGTLLTSTTKKEPLCLNGVNYRVNKIKGRPMFILVPDSEDNCDEIVVGCVIRQKKISLIWTDALDPVLLFNTAFSTEGTSQSTVDSGGKMTNRRFVDMEEAEATLQKEYGQD